MWESFKREHGHNFSTMEEETRRFGHFLENLKMADNRNDAERKAGGSAVHGVTKFSHLSQVEFESTVLTANKALRSKVNRKVDTTVRKLDTTADVVDWTGIYTTPVKNQGYCGSCWAFSATEQIESDTMRNFGVTYILSPEQITQCATQASGCNGGWTEVAYDYVQGAGGIVLESSYPYTSYYGTTGICKVNLSEVVVNINGYTTISGEDNMAAYVQTTGPLSVCLDASTWNSYTGGIMSVCGNSVDHCVQAVGVYAVSASNGGYWKVRNQWGTSWGESGFIQLAYGQNTCDITNDPTYTY
jgi:C1A family cysteine protease